MSVRPLTIVQMLPSLSSGGVEKGTLEVGQHLSSLGHRSIVISAGGRMVSKLTKQGSEHLEWSIGKKSLLTLRLVSKLRDFLEKEKVDILHVRSRFPAWVAYLAWRNMDPKTRPSLVTTVHGPYSVSQYSSVMTKGERIIVVSEMIRDYVTNHYQVDSSKLRLVYRGVDCNDYSHGYQPDKSWIKDWNKKFPQAMNKKILTLPARISSWKGQEDFIDLVYQIKTHRKDFHAFIVGETKDGKSNFLKKLNKKIDKHNLGDMITITGHRDDVKEIMAISNIVYSLSLEPEAFGRTTIEALSMGVPVIGYAHGGVEEQLKVILPEGRVGVGNIPETAMLTLDWLNKSPVVPTNEFFTLNRMLDNTVAVYEELATTRRKNRFD
jgi:glycosyltransferase involved in cell wall biosynthesis